MKKNPENLVTNGTKIVERNVNALLNRKKQDLEKRSLTEKFVGAITSFAGSMASLYAHSILFGIWIFYACDVAEKFDSRRKIFDGCGNFFGFIWISIIDNRRAFDFLFDLGIFTNDDRS